MKRKDKGGGEWHIKVRVSKNGEVVASSARGSTNTGSDFSGI